MSKSLLKLASATGSALGYNHTGFRFFNPYTSSADAAFRIGSVVTAPLVFGGLTAHLLLSSGYQLLNIIKNTLTGDFDAAESSFKNTGNRFIGSIVHFVIALLSPIINLIDIIGSVITSINSCCKSSQSEIVDVEYFDNFSDYFDDSSEELSPSM